MASLYDNERDLKYSLNEVFIERKKLLGDIEFYSCSRENVAIYRTRIYDGLLRKISSNTELEIAYNGLTLSLELTLGGVTRFNSRYIEDELWKVYRNQQASGKKPVFSFGAHQIGSSTISIYFTTSETGSCTYGISMALLQYVDYVYKLYELLGNNYAN